MFSFMARFLAALFGLVNLSPPNFCSSFSRTGRCGRKKLITLGKLERTLSHLVLLLKRLIVASGSMGLPLPLRILLTALTLGVLLLTTLILRVLVPTALTMGVLLLLKLLGLLVEMLWLLIALLRSSSLVRCFALHLLALVVCA